MHVDLPRVLMASAVVFGANFPIGWQRGGVRPLLKVHLTFSKPWWKAFAVTLLYAALSLPVVWLTRRGFRLDPWHVWGPALLLVSLFAQAVGERIRYRRSPPPPEYLRKKNP